MTASSLQATSMTETPVQALNHLRPLDRFTDDRRRELVDAIIADLERWNAPQSARKSAERLRTSNGCAVVTGQQAGIAGGPLFTIYKGLGAIAAARDIQDAGFDRKVVPVFWIESDDHDFDEARTLGLIDSNNSFRILRYDDNDRRRRHIGDRIVSRDGINRLVEELRDLLPDTEFANGAIDLLTDLYRPEETLADGFARFLYALLGETELVVVSARNRVMKRLAADILEAEALDPAPMYQGLMKSTIERRDLGEPTPIEPGEGGLFITVDDERRSLDPVEGGYVVRGTAGRFNRDEVAEIARQTPERLSPNVALRPIVQDAAIPTILYIAGPTEYLYHAQLPEVYHRFDLPQPSVTLRPSALLIEPKVVRALEIGPLTLDDLQQRGSDIAARLIDRAADHAIETAKSQAHGRLEEAWHEFDRVVRSTDPTLEKSIGAGIASGAKEMENIARKLKAALKRREETSIRRMEAARTLLMPGGHPQERALNVLGFIARYGLDAVRETLSRVRFNAGVNVIEIRAL